MLHVILQRLFPKLIWKNPNSSKHLFLTFDDGPIPEVTPWVLEILEQYKVKATFFCIGDNIRKHPEVFKNIIAHGHQVGNHTYNHLNGFKTSNEQYIRNTLATQQTIDNYTTAPLLFRPPYGKITSKQTNSLLKQGFKIVMWTNLTKDYDRDISSEQCLKNAMKKLDNGNIIVFHDSLKAEKHLRATLPLFIKKALEKGHTFEVL